MMHRVLAMRILATATFACEREREEKRGREKERESHRMIKYYFISADIRQNVRTYVRMYVRVYFRVTVWTEAERAACAIIMKSARACICAVIRAGIIFIRGHGCRIVY